MGARRGEAQLSAPGRRREEGDTERPDHPRHFPGGACCPLQEKCGYSTDIGTQQAYLAGKLSAQAKRLGMQLPFCPSFNLDEDEWVLVAEKPNYRHQGDGERKATPNDLITLGIFLGELVALYRKNVDTVQ